MDKLPLENEPEPFAEQKKAAKKLGEAIKEAAKGSLLNDEIQL